MWLGLIWLYKRSNKVTYTTNKYTTKQRFSASRCVWCETRARQRCLLYVCTYVVWWSAQFDIWPHGVTPPYWDRQRSPKSPSLDHITSHSMLSLYLTLSVLMNHPPSTVFISTPITLRLTRTFDNTYYLFVHNITYSKVPDTTRGNMRVHTQIFS